MLFSKNLINGFLLFRIFGRRMFVVYMKMQTSHPLNCCFSHAACLWLTAKHNPDSYASLAFCISHTSQTCSQHTAIRERISILSAHVRTHQYTSASINTSTHIRTHHYLTLCDMSACGMDIAWDDIDCAVHISTHQYIVVWWWMSVA